MHGRVYVKWLQPRSPTLPRLPTPLHPPSSPATRQVLLHADTGLNFIDRFSFPGGTRLSSKLWDSKDTGVFVSFWSQSNAQAATEFTPIPNHIELQPNAHTSMLTRKDCLPGSVRMHHK